MAENAYGLANPIAISRLKKSWLVAFNRPIAEKILCHEIERENKKALSKGHKFAVRLNGTSDLSFTRVITAFPSIQFYDYTKHLGFLQMSKSIENWHVTFSFSGENEEKVFQALALGAAVAFPVVSKSAVKRLVESGAGFDMDKTDLRFLDPQGASFGLLSVKETKGTQAGIEEGFLLSESGFMHFQEKALTFLSGAALPDKLAAA